MKPFTYTWVCSTYYNKCRQIKYFNLENMKANLNKNQFHKKNQLKISNYFFQNWTHSDCVPNKAIQTHWASPLDGNRAIKQKCRKTIMARPIWSFSCPIWIGKHREKKNNVLIPRLSWEYTFDEKPHDELSPESSALIQSSFTQNMNTLVYVILFICQVYHTLLSIPRCTQSPRSDM